MKANELRLGNIIQYSDFKPSIIVNLNSKGFLEIEPSNCNGWISIAEQQAQPIPLTEDWLLKAGFRRDHDWSEPVFVHDDCLLFELHQSPDGVWMHVWDTAFTGAICDHVHQLQNLWFALVNEELTINQ